MKPIDLENRLVDFSCKVINVAEKFKKTKAGNHLAGQIIRSGTSCALNYGEAQSAESKKDFTHKLKIILKELREVYVTLKIVERNCLCTELSLLNIALKECNELISIFVKSVKTARSYNNE